MISTHNGLNCKLWCKLVTEMIHYDGNTLIHDSLKKRDLCQLENNDEDCNFSLEKVDSKHITTEKYVPI